FLIAEQAAFPPLSRRSHREAHETCASQWLPTERRSQSVRNATSLTRSPPCEDASASPWSTRWDDVHAALPRGPPAAATAYDAVRLGPVEVHSERRPLHRHCERPKGARQSPGPLG